MKIRPPGQTTNPQSERSARHFRTRDSQESLWYRLTIGEEAVFYVASFVALLNETVVKGGILFTGSSLMEQFPLNELMMTSGIRKIAYNRGISGFKTEDMLAHLKPYLV